MRKIFFLLSIVLLCSCSRFHSETEVKKVSVKGMIPFNEVTHFEYHRHEYIKFYEAFGDASNAGVVHDPDCKYCNIKEHEK